MLKPIKLAPVFKEIIWGGNRLKKEYNKKSDLSNIAESWELTARPDGMNTIVGGEYDGMTLEEYIKEEGTEKRTVPGSTSFVPPVAGLIIASEVIKDLMK